MAEPRANTDAAARLPLFRPEAMAARNSLQGEILLIRPFSLLFFCGLGTVVSAVLLSFLLLGHYTPKLHVPFSISARGGANAGSQASFYLAASSIQAIRPGQSLVVRCRSCAGRPGLKGTVTQITPAAASHSNLASSGPAYKVTIAFSPDSSLPRGGDLLSTGAQLEAEVPLGREPLIKWLFDRTGP